MLGQSWIAHTKKLKNVKKFLTFIIKCIILVIVIIYEIKNDEFSNNIKYLYAKMTKLQKNKKLSKKIDKYGHNILGKLYLS